MSESRGSQLGWAMFLIVGGAMLLVLNFDWLRGMGPLAYWIVAGALALSGAAFFVWYGIDHAAWWRLIPAWSLIALAGMVILAFRTVAPTRVAAGLLLAGLGTAFLHIYLLDRRTRWWAILPGGFLLVLGSIAIASQWIEDIETLGALAFLGLGAVFLSVFALGSGRTQWWALIPGSVLVLFGLYVLTRSVGENSLIVRMWPLALIAVGFFVLWRALRPAPEERLVIKGAPPPRSAAPATVAASATQLRLGESAEPAPGSSIEVLSEWE
jgi:hypothetical protein